MALTFLIVLPFTQVIDVFLAATGAAVALDDGEGVGVGDAVATAASWVSFTRTVGEEKVKPYAPSFSQPFFSLITVVAVFASPFSEVIETVALIGAELNL